MKPIRLRVIGSLTPEGAQVLHFIVWSRKSGQRYTAGVQFDQLDEPSDCRSRVRHAWYALRRGFRKHSREVTHPLAKVQIKGTVST